jgi:hypothetical protein
MSDSIKESIIKFLRAVIVGEVIILEIIQTSSVLDNTETVTIKYRVNV